MGLTFLGLLVVQITYLTTMVSMRREQFKEAVTRSLYQVSRTLEQDDTRNYLEQEIADSDKNLFSINSNKQSVQQIIRRQGGATRYPDGTYSVYDYQEMTMETTTPKRVSISEKQGKNSISKTSQEIQRELRERYIYQKEIFDYVVLDMLQQAASPKPINERIDFKKLNEYIKAELNNNGLDMPFRFAVVNKENNILFRGNGYTEPSDPGRNYMTVLFRNDPPSRLHILKVNFPTESSYIMSAVKFIVPSFIFTFVLLLTFALTIVLAFREKRLSEMRTDFINNMTHEFKTPISTISLAAQMLKDPVVGKSETMFKHISGVITDETKRLSFQVEKVLQMSMFDRQKTTFKLVEVEVNDLVVNIASTFKLKVEQFGGSINHQLKATNSMVMADEMHFTNVIFNLLDNAVKYKKPDTAPELKIKTWNDNDRLYISIQDNGIGIRKENLKKIFDRFFRVHTGNIHNVKGFGLGLAYVKRIIDEHKGTIRAESELNIGTKFIISLPLIKT